MESVYAQPSGGGARTTEFAEYNMWSGADLDLNHPRHDRRRTSTCHYDCGLMSKLILINGERET